MLHHILNQALNHPYGPLLDSLQYIHVFLALRSPELEAGLQMCFTYAEYRKDHLLQPAGDAFLLG